eukprot:UN15455
MPQKSSPMFYAVPLAARNPFSTVSRSSVTAGPSSTRVSLIWKLRLLKSRPGKLPCSVCRCYRLCSALKRPMTRYVNSFSIAFTSIFTKVADDSR